jgi:MFS family permease
MLKNEQSGSLRGAPDHGYGWVMVGLGALMICTAVGAMFSLAVFLEPITLATGWSRAAISSAMTLNFIAMGIAGFGWGALSDRFGPRPVVLTGAVLLGLGLALASRAQRRAGDFLSSASADSLNPSPHRRG